MRYALSIESILCDKNKYRLNNKFNWVPYPWTDVLGKDNYYTADKKEIIQLQKPDVLKKIGDKEFMIEPDKYLDTYKGSKLFYQVYGFRENFPDSPNKEQLHEVLLKGDDTVRNNIVLKTDGTFCLFQEKDFLEYGVNPGVVVQFEGFGTNKGYVGKLLKKFPDKDYVSMLYNLSMRFWLNQLLFKRLNIYAELNLKSFEKPNSPESINFTLSILQKSWRPNFE